VLLNRCVIVPVCLFLNVEKNYKFWWNQELDALKQKSQISCRASENAGKPKHGILFIEYKKDKLLY